MPATKLKPKTIRVPRPDRPGFLTYEDYSCAIAEGQKADLIDGVIYMASPDNTDANDLFMWLSAILYHFCEHHDLGKVYGSRVAFKLDAHNSPEPDIGVVLKERVGFVERGCVRGPADLAIEIVSPESVRRDSEKKRVLYERFAFPEYWIVDEELQKVTLLRIVGKAYREVKPKKGVFASAVLPGFWLKPEWLWQRPRKKSLDVFAEVLAGRPTA